MKSILVIAMVSLTLSVANAWYCECGHFCPDPVKKFRAPHLCPTGFYCTKSAYNATSTPRICSPGHLCPRQGLCATLSCPAGAYCPAGSSAPLPCTAGSYCLANASAPIPCKSGTYSVPGATTPAQCTPPVGESVYNADYRCIVLAADRVGQSGYDVAITITSTGSLGATQVTQMPFAVRIHETVTPASVTYIPIPHLLGFPHSQHPGWTC